MVRSHKFFAGVRSSRSLNPSRYLLQHFSKGLLAILFVVEEVASPELLTTWACRACCSRCCGYPCELLERLASLSGKNPQPSESTYARETVSPSTAKPPANSRASAKEGSPIYAVITKIDRMKTRQGESLFLKVDVGGDTVRVFGCPEELAERLEASGHDIPASEIEAGMELHRPCLVKVGQGNNGYKTIREYLPQAA